MLELDEAQLEAAGVTLEEARELVTPVTIGPTWKRNEDGAWLLPDKTLGWEIIGWCAQWLQDEDGNRWTFTKEQARFILWWYAVDNEGRFVYRTGVLQRLKGWGKDPLVAVMCIVELAGPSQFSHWDAEGQPVGKAHPAPWIMVAAVSQTQTGNTMSLIPSMMTDGFKTAFNVKDGAEIIRCQNGRGKIEAATSSYRAIEGKRTTFVVLNETHHWVSGNNGHKMFETIDGNTTKAKNGQGRYLAITNAYLPGEDSVAERMRLAWEKLRPDERAALGVLYDSLEANAKAPLTGPLVRQVIEGVRGDAVWLDIHSIMQSIANSDVISAARSRRMWLNQITADADALHSPQQWDSLAEVDKVLMPGEKIVLGFDGGKTDDSTALVAIRVHDRKAFLLLLEERPDSEEGVGWQVDRVKVDRVVRETLELYDVQAFFADVALWESYISDWEFEYGEKLIGKASEKGAIGWDMRRSIKEQTFAHEALMRTVWDGKLRHDGDPRLRRHVLNARRRNNTYGVYFGKESRESPRKVDAYAALMLAHLALEKTRKAEAKRPARTGQVWAF